MAKAPKARSPEIDEIDESDRLTNSQIAELLATEAEELKQPLQKAFRRASRKALLWPEEASQLQQDGRSLTELAGHWTVPRESSQSMAEIAARYSNRSRDSQRLPDMDAGGRGSSKTSCLAGAA